MRYKIIETYDNSQILFRNLANTHIYCEFNYINFVGYRLTCLSLAFKNFIQFIYINQ